VGFGGFGSQAFHAATKAEAFPFDNQGERM
jgi:hypothetical protein